MVGVPNTSLNQDRIFVELTSLLVARELYFTDYCKILELGTAAVRQGNDEKSFNYREQEQDIMQKIVATDKTFRELEKLATLSPSQSAFLEEKKTVLEALRQQAVTANECFRMVLDTRLREIRNEITAVGEKLRSMPGGKNQTGAEPIYIDIRS